MILMMKTPILPAAVDTEYLDHSYNDIGEEKGVTSVKVRKWGTYYCVEDVAPQGYTIDRNVLDTFTVGAEETELAVLVSRATDTRIKGSVTLTKTARQATGIYGIGDKLPGAVFRLVTKDAPTTAIPLLKLLGQDIYVVKPADTSIPDTSLFELDSGALKDYDRAVTNSEGQFTIQGIEWGDYYLQELTATSGFAVTDSNTGEARQVNFTAGRNNCELVQELSCTDEIETARLKLTEVIDGDMLSVWGDPTFIFRLRQTQRYIGSNTTPQDIDADQQPVRTVKLTVEDYSTKTQSTGCYTDVLRYIDENGYLLLEPGTYEISRVNVSRYGFVRDSYSVTDADSNTQTGTPNTETFTLTIPRGGRAEVEYHDSVSCYDKFSHVDSSLNIVQGSKGVKVEDYTVASTNAAVVKLEDLTIKFIRSDGSESTRLTAAQIQSLLADGEVSIAYQPGEKDDPRLNQATDPDFTYQDGIIRINHPERYPDYSLKVQAVIDGFTTTFRIIMPKREQTVKLYERRIIFRADPGNYSYFADLDDAGSPIRTGAFELTFTVEDNEGHRNVSYVRHNGRKITQAQINSLLSDNLLAEGTDWLQIASTYPTKTYQKTWSSGSDTGLQPTYSALVTIVTDSAINADHYTDEPIKTYTAELS